VPNTAWVEPESKRKRQIFTISNQAQWGPLYFWIYFSLFLLLGFFSIDSGLILGPLADSALASFVRGFCLIAILLLSGAILVVAHVSYPRIHNLKVLLLGYLIFLWHSVYVLVRWNQTGNPVVASLAEEGRIFSIILYAALGLNLALIFAVPSYTKFRLAKALLWSIVAGESLMAIILLLGVFGQVNLPGAQLGAQAWILPLLVAALLTYLSARRMKNEYNLGGALAGLAWIYGLAAAGRLSEMASDRAFVLEELCLLISSIVLLVTFLINWLLRMSHRLYYDPLTQIYNREYCEAILEERSQLVFSRPSCVAMFDIDHFKKVNDTYGHAAGDRVLQYVAQRLSREAVPHGIACRYGGEEMIVFFPGLDLKRAEQICWSINRSVKESYVESARRRISITISGGVAPLCDGWPSPFEAMKAADAALYRAKEAGRDRIARAEAPPVREPARRTMKMAAVKRQN